MNFLWAQDQNPDFHNMMGVQKWNKTIMAFLVNIRTDIMKTFFSSHLDIQSFRSVLSVCKEHLSDECYSVPLYLPPPLQSLQPNILESS